MTKAAALEWGRKRGIATEKEKELLRQTSDATRFRQMQAMFSTARSQNWPIASAEDVDLVRARWNKLRRLAGAKPN